jgi:predicted Zn finger-like uncharacterized protein
MAKRKQSRGQKAARQLVRDRERLAALSPGGSADHPIAVGSAAVVETRTHATPCVQCEGEYRIVEHRSEGSGLRAVEVRCQRCGVARTLWFRITSDEPN